MRIDFHPSATAELEASASWYSERSSSAVQQFLLEVDAALAKISQAPERFVAIDAKHRSCNLKRFPYQIVYRHSADQVIVIAIAHAKRRPVYWAKRS